MRDGACSRRVLRDSTRELLAALGEDPAQVAAYLQESGVRGTLRHRGDCAIAVFLNAVLASDPDVRSVTVTSDEVVLRRPQWWRPGIRVSLPEPLRRFVSLFDAGEFPGLTRRAAVGDSASV